MLKFILQDFFNNLNQEKKPQPQVSQVDEMAQIIKQGTLIKKKGTMLSFDQKMPSPMSGREADPVISQEILQKLKPKQSYDTIVQQLTTDTMYSNFSQVAVMGTNESFGEGALINNKPRTATIRCLEPTFFGVMNKKDYEKCLGRA